MAIDAHRCFGRPRREAVSQLLRVAFSVLAVASAFRWAQESLPRYLPKDWSRAHEYDALQDWQGARMFELGHSPYTARGLKELNAVAFGHPPTAPFLLIPIAHFDKALAAEIMDLSTWLLLVVHLYICARAVRFPAPKALTVLLFGWALTTSGFVAHWHAIQSSEQIAFAITVCWVYLRQGRQWQAGSALGVAATFKLFPGVLFLFLLFARRFRALAAATLVYAGIAAFMSLTFGMDAWWLFLKQQGPVTDAWLGDVRNGSLHGLVLRLWSPACIDPAPHATGATNAVAFILAVVLLFVAGALSLRACARARETDPLAIDAPFALFSVLAVFLNPWVWNHYWVLLIQPAFVVASALYVPFRDALENWIDELGSARALATKGAALALGIIGIGAIVELLEMEEIAVDHILALWNASKTTWAHRQLHIYEAVNSLPWGIMLVLSGFTAFVAGRVRTGDVSAEPQVSPPRAPSPSPRREALREARDLAAGVNLPR